MRNVCGANWVLWLRIGMFKKDHVSSFVVDFIDDVFSTFGN